MRLKGRCTCGAIRYALTAKRLELGVQDSVSNVTTGRLARIRITRGELLVFVVTRP